jgi:hypothetical protein
MSRQRILSPLRRAHLDTEQAARHLIDTLPFAQADDPNFLNLKRLAARQPNGLDYQIEQDGHTFNAVQAHSPLCATNRGGQKCDCTPGQAVAQIDPIDMLPHLNQNTGLRSNIPKK